MAAEQRDLELKGRSVFRLRFGYAKLPEELLQCRERVNFMKSNRGAFLVNLDNHNDETDKYTENMNQEQIQEDIKTLLGGFPSTMETWKVDYTNTQKVKLKHNNNKNAKG